MNCPACGAVVDKKATFCPKCFERIEPPGLWQRLLSLFRASRAPRRPIVTIKKTVTIKSTDKDGRSHEYHSLDEAPPELVEELKKLESQALGEATRDISKDGLTATFTSKKSVTVFKVKDASGNERTYHSLDEMPPEIRKAFEAARDKFTR